MESTQAFAAKKRPVKCGQPGADMRRERWSWKDDVCKKDTKTSSGWMRRSVEVVADCLFWREVEIKSLENERMGAEDPNFEGRLDVSDSLSSEEEQLDGPQVEISKRGWACQLPRPRDRRRGVLGRWSACSWSAVQVTMRRGSRCT